jgi:hypothetical protein
MFYLNSRHAFDHGLKGGWVFDLKGGFKEWVDGWMGGFSGMGDGWFH